MPIASGRPRLVQMKTSAVLLRRADRVGPHVDRLFPKIELLLSARVAVHRVLEGIAEMKLQEPLALSSGGLGFVCGKRQQESQNDCKSHRGTWCQGSEVRRPRFPSGLRRTSCDYNYHRSASTASTRSFGDLEQTLIRKWHPARRLSGSIPAMRPYFLLERGVVAFFRVPVDNLRRLGHLQPRRFTFGLHHE